MDNPQQKNQIEGKKMTDEERLELANKLDKDLDTFIDGLEKRQYTEGWPEDRWEEEMDKHPFFMKSAPEIGDELHPLLEGIQQLKYDTEENTNEDLANTHKEDGNFYVKHKKFNMAIFSYTEGLNKKCINQELNAQLYNNRSAAHYFLKNYRSSLMDATKAIHLKPNYPKAEWRKVLCNKELKKYDECIGICSKILENDAGHQLAIDMRKKCVQLKSARDWEERKRKSDDVNKAEKLLQTQYEIEKRGVKFLKYTNENNKTITAEMLISKIEVVADNPVYADDQKTLFWPIMFCYPEYSTYDVKIKVNENEIMHDVIGSMLNDPDKKQDTQNTYTLETINVYYIHEEKKIAYTVDFKRTVKWVIRLPGFYVTDGYLNFFVVRKESDAEKEFLKNYKVAFTHSPSPY